MRAITTLYGGDLPASRYHLQSTRSGGNKLKRARGGKARNTIDQHVQAMRARTYDPPVQLVSAICKNLYLSGGRGIRQR